MFYGVCFGVAMQKMYHEPSQNQHTIKLVDKHGHPMKLNMDATEFEKQMWNFFHLIPNSMKDKERQKK